MNTKGISVAIGANLQPIQRGFNQALAQSDQFGRSLSGKLGNLDTSKAVARIDAVGKALARLDAGKPLALPAPGGAGTGGLDAAADGSPAGDMAGAIMPLAATLGSSLQRAMAPMASFATRFGAQFDKVGGTIITLSRRIDEHMKFPKFDAWITGARAKVQALASNTEGRMSAMAGRVDGALAGIQGFNRLKNFVGSLGDVAGRSMGKLTKIKAPDVNFNSSSKSITNFYGATQLATGGLKSFASQAALALGVFGLGFKAVGWLKDGVKGAMDLGETLSKTKEVFGANTDAITAQADEMASKFGIQKQVSLDAASSFGLIAKAGGLSGDATAKLANDFTKLAGDVSSFYNIPVDQALEKMRSGLVGEAEPMRALGVLLSEDAVKAEAWRSGIAKAGTELTDQQKVVARAALIQQGLKTATGDLERTQDSASNQARKFGGMLTNLATDVGSLLLPALQTGLGLLNTFGAYLGRVFAENKATLESWGASLAEVFATVGDAFNNLPLVFEIGKLSIMQGLLNLGEYFDALGPNVVRVAQWIGENWTSLIRDAFEASLVMIENFSTNVSAVASALFAFLSDPTEGFHVDWTPMLDGFKATVSELPALLRPQLTDMSGQIAEATGKLAAIGEARRAGAAARAAAGPVGAKGSLLPDMGEGQDMAELKKSGAFLKKLKEDVRTPEQKYQEGMLQLYRGRNSGALTEKEFQLGKGQVLKDAGMNHDVKFSGAMVEGSKDAYSSVISAMTGRGTDLAKSAALTATNTAKIVANTRPSNAAKTVRKVANFA